MSKVRSPRIWHCMRYVRRRRGKEEHGFEPREQGKNLEEASCQTKRRVALYQNCREDQSNHTAGTLSNRDQRPWHTDIWCIFSVADPDPESDPVGSRTFCRIRSRIRNKSFRVRIWAVLIWINLNQNFSNKIHYFSTICTTKINIKNFKKM